MIASPDAPTANGGNTSDEPNQIDQSDVISGPSDGTGIGGSDPQLVTRDWTAVTNQIEDFVAREQFASALRVASSLPQPQQSEWVSHVEDQHQRARSALSNALRQADSVEQAQQLINDALSAWQRPGDREWADSMSREVIAILQQQEDVLRAAEQERRRLYDLTPHGHELTTFPFDAQLDLAIRANNSNQINAIIKQLDDSDASDAMRHKVALWNQRVQILSERINTPAPPTLRLPGMLAGGELTLATAEYITIKQREDSSETNLRWEDLSPTQLIRLCERYDLGTRDKDYALACLAALLGDRPNEADIHAQRAREAGYTEAAALETMAALHRDRSLMEIIERGRDARSNNDLNAIQQAINQLQQHHNAQLSTVQALINDFQRSLSP